MLKCSLVKLFQNHLGKFPMTFSRAFSGTTCLQSHYETLKVNTGASLKEIKESYFNLSKQYHPDLHPNDPTCHDRFIRLQEAYKVLSNAQSRTEYDAALKRQSSASHSTYSRPYGYPDFTQRDEWLRQEQARKEQNFKREFRNEGFNNFNRFYSRPHNMSPEEIERFLKYRQYTKNNHVVVMVMIFIFAVVVVESLFVSHRKQKFSENIYDDVWHRNHGRYYGFPLDGNLNDFEYQKNLRRVNTADNAPTADSRSN